VTTSPNRPPRRAASRKPTPVAPAKPSGARATPRRATSRVSAKAPVVRASGGEREELDAAILRSLRRAPNRAVDLSPLAGDLGLDPFQVQLEVERLHQRGMLIAPFIEPGIAGGAELTEKGLSWLIEYEGGKPSEVPALLRQATDRVRAEDEAARLPRAQVYGVRRG
jgi:hypothetical protein